MVVKSFWLSEEINEDKVKGIAKKENRSVSNLINTLLKNNYDVLNNNLTEGAVE